ncbi:MAG: aminotransferase class I/II-fold pyridoxal phosphate-dependent enzyme [Clostridia bacterium]|nr:aminotransferase class I/II-fold pyridoxal phosphate-dependent enzyme [Clostridia bacterium]
MYKYLIYSQLKAYAKADKSFHMPGHKARGDFKSKFPIAPMDITELCYSDNLMCPTGVISGAQKDLAEILGAKKSFILTDGSSSGVLAMMYAVSKSGNKIIVPRNCHISVWNACKLFGLEPVIVQGTHENGVLMPPSPALIEELVSNDRTISGMIVTSPDYFGNVAPLKKYAAVLKKYSRYLLVDGAHGAHLVYDEEKKLHASLYADLWVDGAHKSLPALTQGAVVSGNNETLLPLLEEGLTYFRTTSPSYPIMASVEYAFKYIANNPKLVQDAKTAVAAFREKCPLKLYPSDDWTKVAIDFEDLGVSSYTVGNILEKKGIYPELADGKYLIFYLSPMTVAADLGTLLAILSAIANDKRMKKNFTARPPMPITARTYSYQYALKQKKELLPLTQSVGRMCAQNAGVTPPCVPIIAAGEMITEGAVRYLLYNSGTFGLEGDKIWVVKK